MLEDTQIKELSAEVDDVLALLSTKYRLNALSLAAIVNARLMWANRESSSEADFRILLRSIAGIDINEPDHSNYSMH
jgi:hypothetical protein